MKSKEEVNNIAIDMIGKFDFETVHRIMIAIDHKWVIKDKDGRLTGDEEVPSIAMMKQTVYELFLRTMKHITPQSRIDHTHGMGGFHVGASHDLEHWVIEYTPVSYFSDQVEEDYATISKGKA